jgi:hypothetical protein
MSEAPAPSPAPDPAPAPAPSPAPSPSPSSDPWYHSAGLDDDSRKFIAAKGLDGLGSVVKTAMDFERIARERNVLPAPDADPAKRLEWEGWKSLGWAENRADYKVDPIKVPEGKSYSTDLEKVFFDAAHEARIPAAQAKAVLDKVAEFGFRGQDELISQKSLELQQFEAALLKEHGPNLPAVKEKATAAARYMGATLSPEVSSALEQAVGGGPQLISFFAKLGDMLGEDTIKGGAAGGGGGTGLTPDGAAAEMDRLIGDKEFERALKNPAHPQHAANNARWNELITLRNRK